MPVTQSDIQAFADYATARVNNGGVESMPQLFRDWLAARERAEVNAAIREGLADIDAGRTQPFFEEAEEFRRQRSLPPRQ